MNEAIKKEMETNGLEVAVIGMAARVPGALNVEEFWDNLIDGIESVSFFSNEELIESGGDPRLVRLPNYVKAGAILGDIASFDAEFFGYTADEARLLDPQTRLFHQCAWSALEDAALDPAAFKGRIGLYAGAASNLLWEVFTKLNGDSPGERFSNSNLGVRDLMCTQVSYNFDLKGPAVHVQTACSTSLVAIHMGCQALLAGECSAALAGGVSLRIPQKSGYLYQEGLVYSSDGHCKPFAANADGTVFGDGVGAVVLMMLTDAVSGGYHIHSIIKGSAVNNDGRRKVGYAAPSVKGQAVVIRSALRAAGVAPDSIGYIEAHGTGTSLGDPIEIEALAQALGALSNGPRPVGSVKGNIGHLNTAAGVVGLIKTVLILNRGKIPPSINCPVPNPTIAAGGHDFFINTELRDWPDNRVPRRAGVSSFGIGGTNAHVVLEEWNRPISPEKKSASEEGYQLLVWSALTENAMRRMTEQLGAFCARGSEISPANAAFTLQTGRRPFPIRDFAVCKDMADAAEKISQCRNDNVQPVMGTGGEIETVFLFPGLGSQYARMGLDLYERTPLFQKYLDRCFEILSDVTGQNFKDILFPETGTSLAKLQHPEIALPLLVAVEYSLASVLLDWGIAPSALLGHDWGHYAAAVVAGIFDLQDGLRLMTVWGRLLAQSLPASMIRVSAAPDDVSPLLSANLTLSAVEAPSVVTVSGDEEAMAAFEGELDMRDIEYRPLRSSFALPSGIEDSVLEPLVECLTGIRLHEPRIPVICPGSTKELTARQAQDPVYWQTHAQGCVRFSDAVQALCADNTCLCLEVGPGRGLSALVSRHKKVAAGLSAVNLMRDPHQRLADDFVLLKGLGLYWKSGGTIDWQRFNKNRTCKREPMPTYPFEPVFLWPANDPVRMLFNILKTGLDKRQPPTPDNTPPTEDVAGSDGGVPSPTLSLQLSRMFGAALGISDYDPDDDFFECGGDSLKASVLVVKINQELPVDLDMAALFHFPTPNLLASCLMPALGTSRTGVPLMEKRDYYPCSSQQKRLYVIQQVDPSSTAYNVYTIRRLKGEIDFRRFQQVFDRMIGRHESLRTSFSQVKGQPVQRIHHSVAIEVSVVDAGDSATHDDLTATIEGLIQPFDLSAPPLWRVALVRESADSAVLVAEFHHIIVDGLSLDILMEEFALLYHGHMPPAPPVHYKEFAQWMHQPERLEIRKRQEAFWLDRLQAPLPVLNLPLDFPRPPVQNASGLSVEARLQSRLSQRLEELARQENVTLFTFVLSAYYVFLHKVSRQRDIIIGAPVGGRIHADFQRVVGMFVNMLAVRSEVEENLRFNDFARGLQQGVLAAFDNQDYPFEDLVEKSGIVRDLSHHPFFDVAFAFQGWSENKSEYHELKGGGFNIEPVQWRLRPAMYDLMLEVSPLDTHVKLTLIYGVKLFRPETASRFMKFFEQVLAAVADSPSRVIRDIEIIPDNEKREILQRMTSPLASFPQEQTLHRLFGSIVQQAGDAIAVRGPSLLNREWPDGQLSYKELDRMATTLAGKLSDVGIRPGFPIALLLSPTLEMVVAILAILKSGASYLPIDPGYPEERIQFIVADSAVDIVVCDQHSMLADFSGHVLTIDAPEYLRPHSEPLDKPSFVEVSSISPAYVIYTSGTTGRPKGVVISHRNVVSLMLHQDSPLAFSPSDVWTMFHSYCFDFSVWEMYGPLLSGGRLVLVPRPVARDTSRFLGFLQQQAVTVLNQTPLAFYRLSEARQTRDTPGLAIRMVIFAGEALNPAKLREWRRLSPETTFVNMYGITETTVHVTFKDIGDEEIHSGVSNIGTPLPTMRALIVGDDGNIAPQGIVGEMLVAGAGVAHGYLNRPELTAERFVRRPDCPSVLYRSGDLVRTLPGGDMEYLGRSDFQVKIRGHRIEVGEIQQRLTRMPGVKNALVIPRTDRDGDTQLCAYVVVSHHQKRDLEVPGLKRELERVLPAYMIPAWFVPLEAFPTTPSGKIDRGKLPDPGLTVEETHVVLPGNDVEFRLEIIWRDVLGVTDKRLGIDANFFQLGGHSLKATSLSLRIQQEFGILVSLTDIFGNPTIRQLATLLTGPEEESMPPVEAVEKRDYYPLSASQGRFFVLHGMMPDGVVYNMPALVALDEWQVDPKRLSSVFSLLMARHESFRTSFVMKGREPVQRIADAVDFTLEELGADLEAFVRPFDLSRPPLFRAGIARRGDGYVLALDMHHIISDGVSMEIFVGECLASLNGASLQPLASRYVDFAVWWNQEANQKRIQNQKAFWVDQFSTPYGAVALPLDSPRPAAQTFAGASAQFSIDAAIAARLETLAAEKDVTLFMVFLALFYSFLYKITGQEDIVVGTPAAGRDRPESRGIIGNFVNTLPLRLTVDGALTFEAFLKNVRDYTLQALENQSYPFEDLVETLDLPRDAGRNPLFDVAFLFQDDNGGKGTSDIPLRLESPEEIFKVTKVDVTLLVDRVGNDLIFGFEYFTSLFSSQTIQRFGLYFQELLAAAAANPAIRLRDISIVPPSQKKQIQESFNDSGAVFPAFDSIIDVFVDRLDQFPHAVALVEGDQQWSYRFFDRKRRDVAAMLNKRGCAGAVALLAMERSPDLVAAVFGILSVGAMYVPVDPSWSQERISYIASDSGVAIIVDHEGTRNPGAAAEERRIAGSRKPQPSHPAYVIYTSGSTGRPKGVMVNHASLLNFGFALDRAYPMSLGDAYMMKNAVVFDALLIELFNWFFRGGKLAILPSNREWDPAAILHVAFRHVVTHALFVPSMARELVESLNKRNARLLKYVRYLFLGGEVLAASILEGVLQWAPFITVVNMYGPTEATVVACACALKDWQPGRPIPIGKPLANMELYVLDKRLRCQPIGIPGELCVGGAGVGMGYMNRPEFTAGAFVTVELDGGERKTVYRTGDLAHWLEDGNIEFLGRIDRQVKVRGYRVELEEIEHLLLGYEGIEQAVVIPRRRSVADQEALAEDSGGDYLCAYLVAKGTIDERGLERYLRLMLPSYMVPAFFVPLDAIPRTPGGKLDRTALPEPVPSTRGDREPYGGDVSSGLESLVVSVWREVLGDHSFGVQQNFFEAGGNSLDLIRVCNRLTEELGRRVDVMSMFQYPTIRGLCGFLEGGPERERSLVRDEGRDARQTAVAVIGMAGRFPGADNVAAFWDIIRDGQEAVTFYSRQELLDAGVAETLLDNPSYVKCGGGVLREKERFDAAFFGYSPAEAQLMDPQIRLFHETVWEALEHAGYVPDQCEDAVGLYAGSSSSFNWQAMVLLSGKHETLGAFAASQLSNRDMLPTRVSYKLNLSGPSFLVQTACSTSLVAVDLACRGLLDGQCRMAVAGGVSVVTAGKSGYLYEEGMIYSPDGHCRPFDSAANGTIPGEGSAAVVLKRLPEAVRDRDFIHALIKGSAVNNDGNRKVGFAAPSIAGQVEAIRGALAASAVDSSSIGYVEAHGTGTALGDPVELEALRQAFGNPRRGYCALGSVKANVGHLDAAAGVAGLIKAVLMLRYCCLPPQIHFQTSNPNVPIADTPFYVNTRLQSWPEMDEPRRAGVSSFGIGGTNAHVVLEEWTDDASSGESLPEPDRSRLFMLSAQSADALKDMAGRLGSYLAEHEELDLKDVAYTLAVGRKEFPYRWFGVGENRDHLASALSHCDASRAGSDVDVVFVFSGQGSQYINMGRQLYEAHPQFRNHLNRCFTAIETICGFDARSTIFPGPEDPAPDALESFAFASPIKFAIEYSLAKSLMDWGIEPAALLGHSFGEYVAACLAGVFSLDAAVRLAWARGTLMDSLPAGAMLGVSLSQEKLADYLSADVSLAAVNSPCSCTVSGAEAAIAALQTTLERAGVECVRLRVGKAGHSHMIEPILQDFSRQARDVPLQPPAIPYVSSLTGDWLAAHEAVDPSYWARHLRCTVRFSDGLSVLLKKKNRVFVQVGCDRSLPTFLKEHPQFGRGHKTCNLLRHPKDDVGDLHFLTHKVGLLWVYGVGVDWRAFYRDHNCRRVPLPTYPFQRRRFWLDGDVLKQAGSQLGGRREPEPEPCEARPELSSRYEAPATELQRKCAAVWGEFFGFQKIGIHDSFFELGGDSLKATRLVSALKQVDVHVSIQQLLLEQTIAGLCRLVESPAQSPAPVSGMESGTRDDWTTEDQSALGAAIDLNRDFEKRVIDRPQELVYGVSPIQDVCLTKIGDHIAGNIVYFEHRFQCAGAIEQVVAIVNRLIRAHGLMRSIIIDRDGGYCIRQLAPADIEPEHVPLFDCSPFEKKQRQNIEDEIFTTLNRPFELTGGLLYRLLVLRFSSQEFLLVIAFNHLMFDGEGIGLLKRWIDGELREEPLDVEKNYIDYVEFWGQRDIDGITLDSFLDVQEFSTAVAGLKASIPAGKPRFDTFELELDTVSPEIKHDFRDRSLLGCGLSLCDLFGVPAIPLYFVSHGRRYKNGDFAGIVGDFHDHIPFMVRETDGTDPAEFCRRAREFRQWIHDHAVNFSWLFSRGFFSQINEADMLSPFLFNAVIGSYDHFLNQDRDARNRLFTERRHPHLTFHIAVLEDFTAGRLKVSCFQNSQLDGKEVCEKMKERVLSMLV